MSVFHVRKVDICNTLGVALCFLLTLIGTVLSCHDVAAGNKTGANGNKTPSSVPCGGLSDRPTFCGQFGVSWRYYTLAEVSSIANYREPAKTCDDEGVEGIYILAYEWVNGNGSFQGKQVLDRPDKNVHASQVRPPYSTGSYKFVGPSTLAGTKTWNEVKEAFDYYKSAFDGSTSWENTTWFCGNEDPSPRTGAIKANSGINVSGVSGDKTGAEVGSKNYDNSLEKTETMKVSVQTSMPQVSGQIWHNQYYKNTSDGWENVKQKAKKYKGITLDLYWDVKGGKSNDKYDACDGKWTCETLWAIPAKETTASQERIGGVNYTVDAGDEYCHTMTVEPTKFQFNNSEGVTAEAGRAHTRACVTVNHVDKPADPKDEFWAKSYVKVAEKATDQLGGYDPGEQESEKDAAVGLKVSIDGDTLRFNFSHLMSYDTTDYWHNMWRNWNSCQTTDAIGGCVGGWDYRDTPTGLTYELTGDTAQVTEVSKDEKSQYTAGKTETDSEGNQSHSENKDVRVATYEYQITGIQPGETKKVCHKIGYNPKYVTTPITEQLVWNGPWSVGPQWIYGSPVGSGSEDSEACIEITRPDDPPEGCPEGECPDGGDPDPYGPKNGGDSASDVMYAGEQAAISWKVKAKSVPTRRVKDYAAVGFVVRDDALNANGVKTNGRTPKDPCSYFSTNATLIPFGATCAEFSGDGLSVEENNDGVAGKATQLVPAPNNNTQDAFKQQIDIAVPDNVGGKYCNSYGYKWGYWWGVAKAETGDKLTDDIAEWTYVAGKDYWTNYSATCRTIAKKPNFAIWNGSLFSSSDVLSSTAPRHNTANVGQPTKLNNDSEKTTYGSWAENLVVAEREVKRFASSGAYGAGLPGLVSGNKWDMAWQTISNVGLAVGTETLGNSNINYNSSYSTRLSAYLKSHATNDVTKQADTEFPGVLNATGTQIFYFNPGGNNGTLKITGDVRLNSTSYATIYEMPQVVIYVDGDVKIDPNVEQLDAWIIASGNVNTCNGWVAANNEGQHGTETRSINRNSNTTCDKQLQINGPVIAGSVTLNRTYGADPLVYNGTGKNTSSEVFNLSALSYLWSFAQAGRYDSSYTDVYSRELAPRY